VRGEQRRQGVAHGFHLGRVERRLRKHGRVPGRDEERVLLAQRYVEVLGEVQHELPARPRSSGLHEREVAGREPCFARELQLAEMAALPPRAQQLAEAGASRVDRRHEITVVNEARRHDYLARNRRGVADPRSFGSATPEEVRQWM